MFLVFDWLKATLATSTYLLKPAYAENVLHNAQQLFLQLSWLHKPIAVPMLLIGSRHWFLGS